MTEAEAGEEILGGCPWVKCNSCQGRGEIIASLKTRIGTDKKTYQSPRMAKCPVCFGKGTFPNRLWHQAAVVLDMKVPPQPGVVSTSSFRSERRR